MMLGKQQSTLKNMMAMAVVLYLVVKVMLERIVHKSIAPNYKDDASKK